MLLELSSQMNWPFAMVCIAFLVLCGVWYVTRRTINAGDLVTENRRLTSENYRLTHANPESGE